MSVKLCWREAGRLAAQLDDAVLHLGKFQRPDDLLAQIPQN
jgi:hypothetical protein